MFISVAMCSCNGEDFIEEQIRSILDQTMPVDEIIIFDDKSDDNTVFKINHLMRQFSKIKLFQNENRVGAKKNFESCIMQTKGDIILLADQDDVWFENKVEKLVGALGENKRNLLVFTDGVLVNEEGKKIGTSETLWTRWGFTLGLQVKWRDNVNAFLELSQNRNKITGATVAFKAQLKKYIFPFELPDNYWHDAWLGLVAAGRNGLMFINEPTIYYRIHDRQQIGIKQKPVPFESGKANVTQYMFERRVREISPRLKLLLRRLKNKLPLFLR